VPETGDDGAAVNAGADDIRAGPVAPAGIAAHAARLDGEPESNGPLSREVRPRLSLRGTVARPRRRRHIARTARKRRT